jgi:hypothetical protein
LPSGVIHSLNRLISRRFENVSIFISHKPPPAYPKFPYHGVNDVKINTIPKYIIGRSMYESTMIPLDWAKKANKNADEVWVPSKFLVGKYIILY